MLEHGEWWQNKGVEDGSTLIEDRLNDFIIKLLKEAFEDKAQRAVREREAEARREQERLRAIEEEKRLAEEKKIQEWDAWMKGWKRAREIRAFIRVVRRKLYPIEGSDLGNRLVWAEAYADRLDPFVGAD